MKQILVVALGILSLFANAQTLTAWKKVQIERFGTESIFKDLDGKKLNGKYKIASKSGNYAEITFEKGHIQGERLDYNSDEQLVSRKKYFDVKVNGEWTFFDENGKIKATENYKNGKKDGKFWKNM